MSIEVMSHFLSVSLQSSPLIEIKSQRIQLQRTTKTITFNMLEYGMSSERTSARPHLPTWSLLSSSSSFQMRDENSDGAIHHHRHQCLYSGVQDNTHLNIELILECGIAKGECTTCPHNSVTIFKKVFIRQILISLIGIKPTLHKRPR